MKTTRAAIIKSRIENPCANMQYIGSRLGVSREYVRQVLSKERLPTKKFRQRYICLDCGKEILHRNKLFCNRKCYHNYCLIKIECDQCGTLFERLRSLVINYATRSTGQTQKHYFCSISCRDKFRKGENK